LSPFPDDAAAIRLVGAILAEQHDEGAVRRARCMTLETMTPSGDDPVVTASVQAAAWPGQARR